MGLNRKNLAFGLTHFGIHLMRVKATGEHLIAYLHDTKGVFFGKAWHPADDYQFERYATFAERDEFLEYYPDWPKPILEDMACRFLESE